MTEPNPLEHHIPGIGVFSINLDAFTTTGLQMWLKNLLKDPHPNQAVIEVVTTEIAKRNLN